MANRYFLKSAMKIESYAPRALYRLLIYGEPHPPTPFTIQAFMFGHFANGSDLFHVNTQLLPEFNGWLLILGAEGRGSGPREVLFAPTRKATHEI